MATNTVSLVAALADYAAGFAVDSRTAIETARHCLLDALAGGFEALREPECAALIVPLVPGAMMPGGARVPGTSLELDPAQAAFCTSLMLCRSASRSPRLAFRGGHTADSLGALLAVTDYQARKAVMEGKSPPRVRDMLVAMVKAVEIQGVLTPEGIHEQSGMTAATIPLARMVMTVVVTTQLGGTLGQVATAMRYACIDGVMPSDTDERHGMGHAGWDRDWARNWTRADASTRAVRHACQAMAAGPECMMPPGIEAVDLLAGKLLGAPHHDTGKSFGTAIIDRIAAACRPQELADLTPGLCTAVDRHFPARQAERIKTLFAAPERLDDLPVNELLAALVTNGSR